MTNSKNSSSPRAANRRGHRAQKAAPGSTDLDRSLKLTSGRALASAGAYVRTNVLLSQPKGEDTRGGRWVVDVTDVDVLSMFHTIDLTADISCMSCKAGGRAVVTHETFALAGVMRYLRARRGYAVFSQRTIEGHMAALGQQLDIALMDQPEWDGWLKRVTGAYSVPRHLDDDVDLALSAQLDGRADLEALFRYLRSEYWFYRDYRNIQRLIQYLRQAAPTLNASALSQFIVWDAAGLFALALLQLSAHVTTMGVSRLTDTVPPYLFGGVATYRNRRDLLQKVEQLLRSKGVLSPEQGMPNLHPAYLNDLLEMVLRWANKPAAAARVPQYLAMCAGNAGAASAGLAGRPHTETSTTEKLGMDLIEFLAKAGRLRDPLVAALTSDDEPSRSAKGPPRTAEPREPSPATLSSEEQPHSRQVELLDDAVEDGLGDPDWPDGRS